MELIKAAYSTFNRAGLRGLVGEGRGYLVRHPYHIVPRAYVRAYVVGRRGGYNNIADPMKLVYVDPDDIRLINMNGFNKYKDIGRIIPGDWDLIDHKFNSHPKYQAVYDRFVNDMEWSETGIYDYLTSIIEDRGRVDGCYSMKDIKNRYREIDQLYESISENGFIISQEEEPTSKDILDQICVSIGSDGQLIFEGGGFHRLSISKVLDLDRVPVRVIVRHKGWQQKREEVGSRLNSDEGLIFQHPDLGDINPNVNGRVWS